MAGVMLAILTVLQAVKKYPQIPPSPVHPQQASTPRASIKQESTQPALPPPASTSLSPWREPLRNSESDNTTSSSSSDDDYQASEAQGTRTVLDGSGKERRDPGFDTVSTPQLPVDPRTSLGSPTLKPTRGLRPTRGILPLCESPQGARKRARSSEHEEPRPKTGRISDRVTSLREISRRGTGGTFRSRPKTARVPDRVTSLRKTSHRGSSEPFKRARMTFDESRSETAGEGHRVATAKEPTLQSTSTLS